MKIATCPKGPVPKHLSRRAGLTFALLAALGLAGTARAGGTRTFRLADFDDFDAGEGEGAAIEASGKVTSGLLPARADIAGASAFTCLADRKDGKLGWVGTADAATIQRVQIDPRAPLGAGKPAAKGEAPPPRVEKFAELKGAVVSALAQLPSGELLAATLPGGVIYKIDAKGKPEKFAELKVEQIWAIVPHQGRLLVGTGPKGELLSLDMAGKDTKVLLDSDEKDILSVLTVGKEIVVGTSPGAKVLQVGDPVEGVLLRDFDADEVRSLALTDAGLVAAVNDAPASSASPPTVPSRATARPHRAPPPSTSSRSPAPAATSSSPAPASSPGTPG
jgi:hypothetical protein